MAVRNLLIEKSRYVLSVHGMSQLPTDGRPEVAFFGRSNVGKSSLINFLLDRKEIAEVSRTPGRTKGVNVYETALAHREAKETLERRPFYVMDLPGFGYAKAAKTDKAKMSGLLSDYLHHSQHLVAIYHLLDSRREVSEEDKEVSQQIRESNVKYSVLFTKIDRVPLAKRKPTIIKAAARLGLSPELVLPISSMDRLGRDRLLESVWDSLVG